MFTTKSTGYFLLFYGFWLPTLLLAQTEENAIPQAEITVLAAQYETVTDTVLVNEARNTWGYKEPVYEILTDTIEVPCEDALPTVHNNLVKYTNLTEQLQVVQESGYWTVIDLCDEYMRANYTQRRSPYTHCCCNKGKNSDCNMAVYKKIPPQYETLSTQIVAPSEECQVEGPLEKLHIEKAEDFILVEAASTKMSTRKANAQQAQNKNFACLQGQGDPVDCIPSRTYAKTKGQYQTITREVAIPSHSPSDSQYTITKRVLVKEAADGVPAVYKTVTETILVKPTICFVQIPDKYKTVTETIEVKPGKGFWLIENPLSRTGPTCGHQAYNPANDFEVYEQTIPAKYRTAPKELAQRSYCAPPVSGMPLCYEIRTQQKLVSPAQKEITITHPAEYKIVHKQVLVKPVETIKH